MSGILFNMTELLKYRNFSCKLYEGTVVDATEDDTKDNPFDVGPFKEATFFLNCTVLGGTNVTVKIVTLDPVAKVWHDLVAFTALTEAGEAKKEVVANLGDKIAVVVTPTGTGNTTLTVGGNFKIM